MSRPPRSIEELERRKSYAMQSFMGFRKDLSPTPTDEETATTSSSLNLSTYSLLSSPEVPRSPEREASDDSSSSSSTLPSLIIEREVKRINYDETEEFYAALHIKMLKLYKHMFIKGRRCSTFDEFASDTNNSTSSSIRNSRKAILEPDEGRSSSEPEDITKQEQEEEMNIARVDTPANTNRVCRGTIENTSILPEKVTAKRSLQSPPRDLEVMRSRRNAMSGAHFSPQDIRPRNTSGSLRSPERPAPVRERPTTSFTPPVLADPYEADFDDIPNVSTPKSSKRKTEGESHGCHTKKKRSDLRDEVFKNFFVGRPRVYSLVERHSTSSEN